ncbi:hypothetical protein SAICODRAFT_25854 [Saitoella complicata NRRL Y-17804]|nr:uncharacterized protein SAICODRAFT_25854 [Saitoella complicata NRRL Y-17804]ODQ52559.1 hypothetical protein SAICODRAFT_25854 [Saitoella complicata NRRL Y-17804]
MGIPGIVVIDPSGKHRPYIQPRDRDVSQVLTLEVMNEALAILENKIISQHAQLNAFWMLFVTLILAVLLLIVFLMSVCHVQDKTDYDLGRVRARAGWLDFQMANMRQKVEELKRQMRYSDSDLSFNDGDDESAALPLYTPAPAMHSGTSDGPHDTSNSDREVVEPDNNEKQEEHAAVPWVNQILRGHAQAVQYVEGAFDEHDTADHGFLV